MEKSLLSTDILAVFVSGKTVQKGYLKHTHLRVRSTTRVIFRCTQTYFVAIITAYQNEIFCGMLLMAFVLSTQSRNESDIERVIF